MWNIAGSDKVINTYCLMVVTIDIEHSMFYIYGGNTVKRDLIPTRATNNTMTCSAHFRSLADVSDKSGTLE